MACCSQARRSGGPDPKYQTLAIFSLILWDPEAGRAIRYIPDPVPDTGFRIEDTDTYAVSPDGKLVAGIMQGSRDGPVLLFETATWTLVGHFFAPPTPKHPDGALCIAFSPDGREIAVGTLFGYVHVLAIGHETPRLSFLAYPDDVPCYSVAYSHNGQILATGRGQVPLERAVFGLNRGGDSRIGQILIQPVGWAEASRNAEAVFARLA
jgi:WD40 repeat protein